MSDDKKPEPVTAQKAKPRRSAGDKPRLKRWKVSADGKHPLTVAEVDEGRAKAWYASHTSTPLEDVRCEQL